MTEVSDRVAGWLRSINLDPGATRQDAIVAAAASLAKEIGGKNLLNLVLLAHDEKSPEASNLVAETLRAQDQTWDVREGDKVEALTAATAAAIATESEPAMAVPFSLAVRAATFCGLSPSVKELPDLAVSGLVKASETLRARHALLEPTADVKGLFAGVTQQEGQTATSADLKALVKGVTTAFNRAVAAAGKVAKSTERRVEAAEEELNLLWWVFGDFSELARKPFKDVPDHASACVAGIEMASLLREPCPLPSTRALLSRVLGRRLSNTTTLEKAVPATSNLIEQSSMPKLDGHRLLPVFSSIGEFAALEGKDVWKESVSRWGIDAGLEHSDLDLAEQAAREVLLARHLVNDND